MTQTKTYDFDTLYDRSNTSSTKWTKRYNYKGEHVPIKEGEIPLWVAEMEFPIPPEIREAMKARIDHGFLGYTVPPENLKDTIVERMKALYNYEIQADWILFNPGMVMFLGVITRALTKPGSGILMHTPAYRPFLSRPAQYQRFAQKVPLSRVEDDAVNFHYEIDFDSFESAISDQSEMYYLCNPYNPIGKTFTRDELECLAEICIKHNVLIAADEIHSDLLLGDAQHIPIATLSPEIEHNTITLIAGTKSFNMAGNPCSVAIISDEEKRQKVDELLRGSNYHCDTLAYTALLAGYRECDEWLRQLRAYLTGNRDFVLNYLRENMPQVKATIPDGTYMMWLDFGAIEIPEPYPAAVDFFAEEAGVIFSPGAFFGFDNRYVRLNFACPRFLLQEALDKVCTTLENLK